MSKPLIGNQTRGGLQPLEGCDLVTVQSKSVQTFGLDQYGGRALLQCLGHIGTTIGGSAGFEGNSYKFYKGGWFSSDKTVRGKLDAGVDKSLDTAVKQMQLSMAGLAMSIGAPTEAISGFSQAIKLSFNGLDEAGIQEKITQTLADYNEALASAFIASVDRSEVPKWVDRLLGNVDASAVERLQAVAEWPAKLLQSFGTSRDQLAQLYAEGLASVRHRGATWVAQLEPGHIAAAGAHRITAVVGSRLVVTPM